MPERYVMELVEDSSIALCKPPYIYYIHLIINLMSKNSGDKNICVDIAFNLTKI